MICPNCSKEFLSGTVCPYCNTSVEAEAPAAEEKVEAATEESARETACEVTEEATEVAEEVTEEATEEAEETADEADENAAALAAEAAEIAAILEKAEKPKKKLGFVGVVAIALAAIIVVLGAFLLGGVLLGNKGDTVEETGAVTENTGDAADEYQVNYPKGFDFLSADYSEYLTLGQYKGLTFNTDKAEVSDAEVASYISTQVLPSFTVNTEVTGRAAKLGDTVVVDYSGAIDGVKFDGGTAEKQTVEIGAGGYIDGFEDGIIGMNVGDTKTVDCIVPENYGAENLAGKTAQFTFTLHSISEKTNPEYNDAFVSEKLGFASVAEFEAYIKDGLTAQKEATIDQNNLSQIIEVIYNTSEFKSVPEGLVEDYVYSDRMQVEQMAAMYGMELDDLLMSSYGITAEQYEAEGRVYFTEMLKQKLAVFAIAKAEGITASDSDVALLIPEYLEQFGVASIEEFVEKSSFTEEELLAVIEQDAVEQKTLEFLMNNTTFNVVE